jgi:predicted Ser/Thr protein kinase
MEPYADNVSVCPRCGYVEGTKAEEVHYLQPGTLIGKRYRVGKSIGSGSTSITYIAYDLVLNRKVSLREYFPIEFSTRVPGQPTIAIYSGDSEGEFEKGRQAMIDESRRLGQFQSEKNILHVFTYVEENNTVYMVMEYLQGETLEARLARTGPLPVEEALPIVEKTLEALRKLHDAGILHRAIDPENLFLLDNGEVKLYNFAAARHATTSLTKSLTVMVKEGFTPIEQYQSHGKQGSWTDVYALAATFYKMLTGKTPPDAMKRRLKDELKEPSKLGVAIPKNIENSLMNAMHVMADDRTKTVDDFTVSLHSETVERVTPQMLRNDFAKWPAWVKFALAGAGLLCVAVLALTLTGIIGPKEKGPGEYTLAADEIRIYNLVGRTVDDAADAITAQNADFKVDKTTTRRDEVIQKGRVIALVQVQGGASESGGGATAGGSAGSGNAGAAGASGDGGAGGVSGAREVDLKAGMIVSYLDGEIKIIGSRGKGYFVLPNVLAMSGDEGANSLLSRAQAVDSDVSALGVRFVDAEGNELEGGDGLVAAVRVEQDFDEDGEPDAPIVLESDEQFAYTGAAPSQLKTVFEAGITLVLAAGPGDSGAVDVDISDLADRLAGMTYAQVAQELGDRGLTAQRGQPEESDEVPNGGVLRIEVNRPDGTGRTDGKADGTDTVRVIESSGPHMVVYEVQGGYSRQEAIAALEALAAEAGIDDYESLFEISEEYSSEVAAGYVIGAGLDPNTEMSAKEWRDMADGGERVKVTVSLGPQPAAPVQTTPARTTAAPAATRAPATQAPATQAPATQPPQTQPPQTQPPATTAAPPPETPAPPPPTEAPTQGGHGDMNF